MVDFIEGLNYTLQSLNELSEIFNIASVSGANNYSKESCLLATRDFEEFDIFYSVCSVLFVISLVLITKRVAFKTKSCYGRPGLPLPMNILNHNDNVYEYIIAFLSLSEDIYQTIFGMKSDLDPIVKFFFKLFLVIAFSITSFPIFAGINGKNLVGYVIGLIYSMISMAYGIINNLSLLNCLRGPEKIPQIIVFVIYLTIDIILFLIFIWKIFTHIKNYGLKNEEIKDHKNFGNKDSYKYVKNLFNQTIEKGTIDFNCLKQMKFNKINTEVTKRIYVKIHGFRIPPLLAIGISVGLYFAYRIFMDRIIDLTPTGWNVINIIHYRYSTTKTNLKSAFHLASGNYSKYSSVQILNAYRFLTLFYTNLIISCLIAAVFIGIGNSIIQSFCILRNYRLHFQKISRKGFSSIIALKKAPDPAGLVSGFVRYSGYQAAYILWGILVTISFTFPFLFIFIGIILLPLIYLENSWIRILFYRYLPVFIGTFLVNLIQSLAIRFLFVKQRGKLMEINNRRAFMIYAHCAFFLNVMMGIFNSIKRIIIWIFTGVFCFCRIDFNTLPNYLHNYDNGFMSYIGFLYTEQFHHNPVVKCFINLLIEELNYRKKLTYQINNEKNEDQIKLKRKEKYRTKWKVAFTLINNCQLQVDRKKSEIKILNEMNFEKINQ